MTTHDGTKLFYQKNSEQYIQTTKNVNMSIQYNLFLRYMKAKGKILDIGFGSGRDMLFFQNKGFEVVGIDITENFVDNARNQGLCAYLQDIHTMDYNAVFDGVWACASLLHSPDLPLAFSRISKALKKNGVFYLSMKYGDSEKIIDEKFYRFLNELQLYLLCDQANLKVSEILITNDLLDRKERWLNAIILK